MLQRLVGYKNVGGGMTKLFHRLDRQCNGWLQVGVLIVLEIIVIYFLSNLPFILAALEVPVSQDANNGFYANFSSVLQNEINKGQLLTFVCALISPVVFWSFVEFRKAIMTKMLSFLALILLMLAAYLHGKGSGFVSFASFDLYIAALAIWVLSILSNRIPPNKDAYFNITESETESFVEMTRKG